MTLVMCVFLNGDFFGLFVTPVFRRDIDTAMKTRPEKNIISNLKRCVTLVPPYFQKY